MFGVLQEEVEEDVTQINVNQFVKIAMLIIMVIKIVFGLEEDAEKEENVIMQEKELQKLENLD